MRSCWPMHVYVCDVDQESCKITGFRMFDGNFRRPRPSFEITSLLQGKHKTSVTDHRTFLESFQNASLGALKYVMQVTDVTAPISLNNPLMLTVPGSIFRKCSY